MCFTKYPKMMNHYHKKKINRHLKYNPECMQAEYIAQIKYDGSNISLIFVPGKGLKAAKRSGKISDNFNNIWNVLKGYKEFINYFQGYSNKYNQTVQVYGEIFGQGIQNRIYYGPKKYIRFFDVRVDDFKLTQSEIEDIFNWDFLEKYWVETFKRIYTLNEALEIDPPEEHEGIVIKQYCRILNEELLYIKKKNPKFEEKMKPKKKKGNKEPDPETQELKSLFLQYINENRVRSVFSKEGEIQEPEQIGKYLKLVVEDAKEDFKEENDLTNVDKSKMNGAFKSASKEVVELLKRYL